MDKSTGVRSDQTVILSSFESASAYPDPLRKVSYYDAETNKRLKFLTNNFALPALTIAQIYKQRWRVELFFKWIKQHLRIKAFYGTSENAVKTQIWIYSLEVRLQFFRVVGADEMTRPKALPMLLDNCGGFSLRAKSDDGSIIEREAIRV